MSSPCLVIAHRGARGATAPNQPADNTLEAFEAAIDLGADMIELDVRRTRDGHLVVFHDARVKTVPTSLLRYEALRIKGTKSRPPLLEDVLMLTKDRIALNLEVKEAGYVEETIALLRPFGLERCLLSSFLDEVVVEAKALAPELRTGLLLATGFRKALTTRLPASKADCLCLHHRLANNAGASERRGGRHNLRGLDRERPPRDRPLPEPPRRRRHHHRPAGAGPGAPGAHRGGLVDG